MSRTLKSKETESKPEVVRAGGKEVKTDYLMVIKRYWMELNIGSGCTKL